MNTSLDRQASEVPHDVRPRWSILIPAYNPSDLLRDAIASAQTSIAVTGEVAQLEIVDDASSEVDVGSLVRSWGFHSVAVHRRSTNGGLGACWNDCIARARGELIHILHQDDLVKPPFYESMGRLAAMVPTAGMYFCRTEFLHESGAWLDELEQSDSGLVAHWLERICERQRLQCPSVVVRRGTYERVGSFETSLRYAIDWEMWIRIAASHAVAYLTDALASYRIHSGAETRRVKSSGIATRDLALALSYIRRTLARADRLDCFSSAQRFALNFSRQAAYEAEAGNDWEAAAGEIAASIRYMATTMSLRDCLWHIRWYLKLRLNLQAIRERARIAGR